MGSSQRRREKRRERREKARKRAIKRMRRLVALLVMLIAVVAVIFVSKHRKTEGTEEETAVNYGDGDYMAVGEAAAAGGVPVSETHVSDNTTGLMNNPDYLSGGVYEGAVDISSKLTPGAPLDVTTGQSAVDLTDVPREKRITSAKAAMQTMSLFTGTSQTVDHYLQRYGEGKWFGVRDVDDTLQVFYEGTHVRQESYVAGDAGEEKQKLTRVPFKVSFVVYEDGSFAVRGIEEDGEAVDDWRGWLEKLINT